MSLPFSQACENNRAPILDHLQLAFAHCRRVLEIGSGTGQHAVYFAPRLPHLTWQTSDLAINHAGINAWIDAHPAVNLLRPLDLDVSRARWPVAEFDGAFTANTCHIMPWPAVTAMFAGLRRCLGAPGVLAVYGPFKYSGRFTSASNARFDQWLKSVAPHQGIRDSEALVTLAAGAGLKLVADNAMPANNQLLIFQRPVLDG